MSITPRQRRKIRKRKRMALEKKQRERAEEKNPTEMVGRVCEYCRKIYEWIARNEIPEYIEEQETYYGMCGDCHILGGGNDPDDDDGYREMRQNEVLIRHRKQHDKHVQFLDTLCQSCGYDRCRCRTCDSCKSMFNSHTSPTCPYCNAAVAAIIYCRECGDFPCVCEQLREEDAVRAEQTRQRRAAREQREAQMRAQQAEARERQREEAANVALQGQLLYGTRTTRWTANTAATNLNAQATDLF